jgi:replicative DNA helicase
MKEDYTRKVLPFLKQDYFSSLEDKLLFKQILQFITKYNKQPTYDALEIEVDNIHGGTDQAIKNIQETLKRLKSDTNITNLDWLIDSTEKFCQEKAIYNAITESLEIMKGKTSKQKGAIPGLLTDALAVTFDPNIGHDFLEQYDERFEYYHRVEERIPFDLDVFNKATKNGVSKKTLNLVMGGVHTGKTLFLCHLSSGYLTAGKNVLYITLEMSEEEIAKRIDANTLNVSLDDLMVLPQELYDNKIQKLKSKTQGKLIIKEFAGASASVMHFKSLLNELLLKKNFVPDVIMIDYLNLCASSRVKASDNLYNYVKSIAEEVRGLAQQVGIPIWSATQLNRTGFASSDPDMTDTAESFGLPATVDLQWVLVTNDQLKSLNQMVVKQLKNRYDDLEKMKRFVIGVDKTKMRLYEVEQAAQSELVDTGTGSEKPAVPQAFEKKSTNNRFKGLKV